MVIAETVKYNTTHSKIRDTCIATLNDALHMRGNLFDECRKEACTIIESNLQALAENNDTGIFGDQLKKMYPWFHCFRNYHGNTAFDISTQQVMKHCQ
jgi:hypothetical protein